MCGVAVGLAFAASASAQFDWIARGSGLPTIRDGAAMAYDDVRERTVLFGGVSAQLCGDTWEWTGAAWLPILTAPAPSPRTNHAMAYDSQRDCVVLFGGWNGAVLGDTWEFAGGVWAQRATSGPSPRSGMAMAYDSVHGRTVLFGGLAGTVFAGDTWQWDGASWTQLAATGPAPRQAHAMAFDDQRGRVVLFGGQSVTVAYTLCGDTWEWNGSAWTQVASSGAPPRAWHGMVYDLRRGSSVVFGGEGAGAVLCGDTWEWTGFASWTPIATSTMVPRVDHAMAYDRRRQCTVMFGGYTGNLVNDVWELTSTSATSTPYGVGCGSPELWLLDVPSHPPTIGGVARAAVGQIPASFASIAIGTNRDAFGPWPLPLSLAGIGMPGCTLLHSCEIFGLAVSTTGMVGVFSQPLPDFPPLIGQHLFLQAFALAPGVNATGVVASNGLDWYIGR